MTAALTPEEYWDKLRASERAWPAFWERLTTRVKGKISLGGLVWSFGETSKQGLFYGFAEFAWNSEMREGLWLVVMEQSPNSKTKWAQRETWVRQAGQGHLYQVYRKTGPYPLAIDGTREWLGVLYPDAMYEPYRKGGAR